MSVRANWRGTVIAESDRRIIVEGNHCFLSEAASRIAGRIAFWKGVTVTTDVSD